MRCTADAANGVKRRPRGRAPLSQHWDGCAGAWVLDDGVTREMPALPAQPIDLNAWAAANPPPRREDFESQELFDDAREPWYATLMGQWLPPYGDNAARAYAWGRACRRCTGRVLSHEIAEERALEVRDRAGRKKVLRTTTRVLVYKIYSGTGGVNKYSKRRLFVFSPRFDLCDQARAVVQKLAHASDVVKPFSSLVSDFSVEVRSRSQAAAMHAALRDLDDSLPESVKYHNVE